MGLERYRRTARFDAGSPDMYAARKMQERANTFSRFADDFNQRRDKQVADESLAEGKTQGAEDPFSPKREGGNIADDAYNRGLEITRAAGLANDAKAALDRFHLEHPNDMGAFVAKVDAYSKGIKSQLDEDAAALFDLELGSMATQRMTAIDKQVRVEAKDAGRAEILLTVQNVAEESQRAARDGDVAAQAHAMAGLDAMLNAALVGDLLTEAETIEIRAQARDKADRDLILGAFEKTLAREGIYGAEQKMREWRNSRPADLSPDEHRKIGDQMQALWSKEVTRQTRMRTLQNANQAAIAKQYKDKVKDLEYAAARGKIVPDADEIAEAVAGTPLADDVSEALTRAVKVDVFSKLPPEQQAEVIAKGRANKTMSADDVRDYEAYEKQHNYQMKLLEDDAMAYGQEVGLVGDLPPFDPANPGPALEARALAADAIEAHTGYQPSPLSNADELMFSRAMRGQPGAVQAQVLGAMVDGLGRDKAIRAMEGMKKDGRHYVAPGIALVEGDQAAAENLLEGREIRTNKDHPNVVPRDVDLVPELEQIYALYPDDPARRTQVIEAVKDAYAARAVQNGNYTAELDSDLVEAAIMDATGGVLESDWGLVTAPARGMDENGMEDWIEGLTEDDLAAAGNVSVVGNKQALRLLKDDPWGPGDRGVTLHDVGHGRYLVKYGAGYWLRDDGEPFVLEYSQ